MRRFLFALMVLMTLSPSLHAQPLPQENYLEAGTEKRTKSALKFNKSWVQESLDREEQMKPFGTYGWNGGWNYGRDFPVYGPSVVGSTRGW